MDNRTLNKEDQLFLSIKDNKLQEVKFWLDAGANQLTKNSDGKAPIEYAADLKHWDCVKKMANHLQDQKDQDSSNLAGYGYALKCAVDEDQNDIAELLMDKGATLTTAYSVKTGYYALHRAIHNKNFALVKSMLDHKATPLITTKITKENDKEITPLEIAITMNEPKMIDLLLKAGAKQSMKKSNGDIAIEYAAKLKHWACVEELAKHLKDVKDHDHSILAGYGYALKCAVNENLNDVAEVLMDKGASLSIAYTIKTGYYALHQAIYNKNFALVKSILDHKADPSVKTTVTKENDKEITPLELAITMNELKIVDLLLKAGAKQSIKNSNGDIPIEYAAKLKNWDCVKLLAKYQKVLTNQDTNWIGYGYALYCAIEENQNKIAEVLMDKGAALANTYIIKSGYFALHQAIHNKNFALVKSLLDHNANPSIKTEITKENDKEIIPLELAITLNDNKILGLLLNAGANQSIKNLDRNTPIEYAANLNHWDCVQQLLEHPCEQNNQPDDSVYRSVLLKAVDQNKNSIAQLLMKKCTSVNTSYFAKTGRYPLHQAIEKGNAVLVKSLLEYKADPLLKTELAEESKEQITAIHLALQLGKKDIIDLLMKNLEEQHAENEKHFSLTISYYSACEKMNSYLKEHKYTDALTQIKFKTNEPYISLFKLAYLNHFIKNKTTDNEPFFINIPNIFEFVPEEGHVFIAQSLLETISRIFEANKKWSQTTKSEMRCLLNTQELAYTTQESSFLLNGLSELKLLENEYSRELQNKIKTNQVDNDLKEVLCKIGAIKYIRQKILSKEYDCYAIKDKLEMLFGIDVLQGKCWKRNPFKHCIDKIITALEKHEKLYGKESCNTPTKLLSEKSANDIRPSSFNPYAEILAANTNTSSANMIYPSIITQNPSVTPIVPFTETEQNTMYPTISVESGSAASVAKPTNTTANTLYPMIIVESQPCASVASTTTAQDSQPTAPIAATSPQVILQPEIDVEKVEENSLVKSKAKRSNSESDISLVSVSNNASSHFHKKATQKHNQSIVSTRKMAVVAV